MKKISIVILGILGLMLALTGCKKEESPAPTKGIKQSWKISAAKKDNAAFTGFVSTFRIEFKDDNTYSITAAGTTPRPDYNNVPVSETGNQWALTDSKLELKHSNSSTSTLTISGLSESGVTIKWTEPSKLTGSTEPGATKTPASYEYTLVPVN